MYGLFGATGSFSDCFWWLKSTWGFQFHTGALDITKRMDLVRETDSKTVPNLGFCEP